MDAQELRNHASNIGDLLSEILQEIKELRKDYAAGQACYSVVVAEPINFEERLSGAAFNHSYER